MIQTNGRFTMKFSAKSILSKKVMSTDARELGLLENIYISQDSGNMIYISIYQKEQLKYNKDKKTILIPFNSICAIKDYIIVDKEKINTAVEKYLFTFLIFSCNVLHFSRFIIKNPFNLNQNHEQISKFF